MTALASAVRMVNRIHGGAANGRSDAEPSASTGFADLDKPVFVVDAYTKRMLYRHNMADRRDDYHSVQEMFMKSLDGDARMFNEYHALIVRLGKDYCRPKPLCGRCLLKDFHYSLTAKCGRCHRALPKRRDRKLFKGGYLCCECRAQ